MRIITVNREFGSGGRELGKRLADALGILYYDREIITTLAEKVSLDETYIERAVENGILRKYPITFSRTLTYLSTIPNNAPQLLAQQHKIIKELAAKSDCVIVGRGSDAILKDYKPLKLFVYADMSAKIERCRNRTDTDEKMSKRELEQKIKQIDKARAANHDLVSSYAWSDKHNYHLCINTTDIKIKSIVLYIAAYASYWFERSTNDHTVIGSL